MLGILESNLSALVVRKSNFKVLIKSSYVISLIYSRECKLYQVITASKPNYSYCTYVFLLFRDFYKCNIHHPFSQGGVISKISAAITIYSNTHACRDQVIYFFLFCFLYPCMWVVICCVVVSFKCCDLTIILLWPHHNIGEVTAAGLEGQDLECLILALETREAYTTEPYYIWIM